MDALDALSAERGWNAAWAVLFAERRPRSEEAKKALAAEFTAAANIVLCWDEAADVIATFLALRDAEEQRIRTSAASAHAWTVYGQVEGDGLVYDDKGKPFDLSASRATAAATVQTAATRALAAEDRLRDSLSKRRDALVGRIYDLRAIRRSPALIDEELADRAARLGDLAALRPLLISMARRDGPAPISTLPAAVDELAEARARAARAAQLRSTALTTSEALAAEEAHRSALAEVRAIEQRDQGADTHAQQEAAEIAADLAARARLPET